MSGVQQPKLVGAAARCIMLTPVGEKADPELREALDRPDLIVVGTDNIYVALAEVCAASRRDVERLRSGGRGEGLILLLSHPERLSDPAALVHTVERYAPQTAIWMFDPAGSPRLRAAKPEDLESWTRRGEAKVEVKAAPRVSLGPGEAEMELSAVSAGRAVDPGRETGKDRQDGGILSEAELAMLLAVDGTGVHNEHDRPS